MDFHKALDVIKFAYTKLVSGLKITRDEKFAADLALEYLDDLSCEFKFIILDKHLKFIKLCDTISYSKLSRILYENDIHKTSHILDGNLFIIATDCSAAKLQTLWK